MYTPLRGADNAWGIGIWNFDALAVGLIGSRKLADW